MSVIISLSFLLQILIQGVLPGVTLMQMMHSPDILFKQSATMCIEHGLEIGSFFGCFYNTIGCLLIRYIFCGF